MWNEMSSLMRACVAGECVYVLFVTPKEYNNDCSGFRGDVNPVIPPAWSHNLYLYMTGQTLNMHIINLAHAGAKF